MRRVIDILSIAVIVIAVVLLAVLASNRVQAATSIPQPWQLVKGAGVGDGPGEPFDGFPLDESRQVSLHIDQDVFDRLSPDEQQAQVLDWLLFAIASDAGLSPEEINQGTYDLPPIRYGFMHPVAHFEYGDTRSLFIGQGQVVALVPAGQPEKWVDHLAGIADRHRKNLGRRPEEILVFEYEMTPGQDRAQVTRRAPIAGPDLFSAAYGYTEGAVSSLGDLEAFLERVDDVTFAEMDGGQLVLGGRRVRGGDYLGITIEDLAAIWQAHDEILGDLRAFESRWEARAAEFNLLWGARTYSTLTEKMALERQMDEEWEQLMLERAEEQMALGLVNGTGFSLDPVYDYASLEALFWEFQPDLEAWAAEPGAPITREEIGAIPAGLAQEDVVPFLVVLDKLGSSEDLEHRFFGDLMESAIDGEFKFQTARYDGNLQGTEVGMTLFYTDLMAKLWDFDYEQSAPLQIDGFVPETHMQLPSMYLQETRDLPYTRLWFGPQNGGFQVAASGDSLLFSRVATRVYAASSNPLQPGVEVEASTPSAHFLGWWNNHYEQVARYEPQYERLNQIMKWSLLVSWLGDARQEQQLQYLADVPVDRSNWFPEWVQDHPELTYQAWDAVEFLPPGYLGTSTEAVPTLFSEGFAMFSGDEEAGRSWQLSGGVSLADAYLFDELAPLSTQLDDLLLRSNLDYSVLDELFTLRTLDDIQFTFSGPADDIVGVTALAQGENVRLRSVDSEVANLPFRRAVNEAGLAPGLEFEMRAGGVELGALEVTPAENGFSVGWQGRDIDAGHLLALDMSTGQPMADTLLQSDSVQAVVALGDDGFLAQMRGSTNWMSFAEETAPSARIPDGWQSRVADPQNGIHGILMGWGDDAVARAKGGGYLLRDPTQPSLFHVVGDDLPAGLRTVEIEGGEQSFTIRLDPDNGDVYFRLQDLPEQDVGLLGEVTRPVDVQTMLAQSSDAPGQVLHYVPESRIMDQLGLRQSFELGDYDGLARMIASDAQRIHFALEDYLSQGLNQVDDLLARGQPARALDKLDDLIGIYGHQADIDLRRALALLEEGQLDLAAAAGNEGAVTPLRNGQSFFDEINLRLSQGGAGMADADDLASFAQFVDWTNLQGQGFFPEGKVALVADGGALDLEYRLGGTLSGEPLPVGALDERVAVYVQDAPGLNNLDWSPGAVKASVNEAVSGDLAQVFKLPQEDIAFFRPSQIYDTAGQRFALAGEAALDVAPVNTYPFHAPVQIICGTDRVCEERERSVYLVASR
jgi:hypothetical protein